MHMLNHNLTDNFGQCSRQAHGKYGVKYVKQQAKESPGIEMQGDFNENI